MSTALRHYASSIAAPYSTLRLYTRGVCVPCSVTLEASCQVRELSQSLKSQSRVTGSLRLKTVVSVLSDRQSSLHHATADHGRQPGDLESASVVKI